MNGSTTGTGIAVDMATAEGGGAGINPNQTIANAAARDNLCMFV